MAKAEVETGKRGRKAAIKAAEQNGTNEVSPVQTPPKDFSSKRGREKKETPIPKTITFFQRLSDIAQADWGTRAKVTIYRLEPLINALVGSEKKYIKVYTQPPVDLERIKQDCGSGRYRLYLNFKAPAQGEREIDSTEIDILDMNFPPKIPKGAWLDDPRNAQWAWAKESYDKQNQPPQQQTQQTGQSVLETLDTMLDVAERMNPKPPTQKSATEELSTLVTVAEKLRPAETVPQFVQLQFAALQAEIAAARKRGDELMMMLIADKKNGSDGSGLNLVKEVVSGLKELVPSIKEIVPGLDGVPGGRSRMGGWQEFAIGLAEHVSPWITPFSGALAQVLMARMTAPGNNGMQQQPHVPALPPGQTVNNPGQPGTMMPFLQMIAMPMLQYVRPMAAPHNISPDELGRDFASWVYDGYGAHEQYDNALMAARLMGPVGIIAQFRSTPFWMNKGPQNNLPSLQELEPRLMPFFQAFLSWTPEQDTPDSEDEPEETDPSAPQVLNFDEKYAEAGA